MAYVYFLATIREGKKFATLNDPGQIFVIYKGGCIFSITCEQDVNRKEITDKLFDPRHYYGKDFYRSEINGPATYKISVNLFNDKRFNSDSNEHFEQVQTIEIDPENEETYVLIEVERKSKLTGYKYQINIFTGDDEETKQDFYEALDSLPYFSEEDRAKAMIRNPKMLESKDRELAPKKNKPSVEYKSTLTYEGFADDIKQRLKDRLSIYLKRGAFFPVRTSCFGRKIDVEIYIDEDVDSDYVWNLASREIDNLIDFLYSWHNGVDEIAENAIINIEVSY